MTLDDRITWYDNNYKRFLFASASKPVVLESVVEPVEEEIINWEASVIVINLSQKNTCYIEKEES